MAIPFSGKIALLASGFEVKSRLPDPIFSSFKVHEFADARELLRTFKGDLEVIIIHQKSATRRTVRQLRKSFPFSELLVYYDTDTNPTLGADTFLNDGVSFFTPSFASRSIKTLIADGVTLSRKRQRLAVLRKHSRNTPNAGSNPAIDILVNLLRRCSSATDREELLAAPMEIRVAVPFRSAILLDESFFEKDHCIALYRDEQESVQKTKLSIAEFNEIISALEDGNEPSKLDNTALALVAKISGSSHIATHGISLNIQNEPKRRLILLRSDLEAFSNDDLSLAALAVEPLMNAFRKLDTIRGNLRRNESWGVTFDAVSEPISVVDESYNLIRANAAFLRRAKTHSNDSDKRKCFTVFARRRTPCPQCPVYAPEHRRSIGMKSRGRYLAWSYPVQSGSSKKYIQFYRNTSKESQLITALVQSEKMAALGSITAAIAHEINNPIAGILATTQSLIHDSEHFQITKELKEDIEEIEQAAKRSMKIIRNLLSFQDEKSTWVGSVRENVAAVLTFAKSVLRRVDTRMEVPENLPNLAMDPSSFQQIFFNLVTNAAHAMPDGGKLSIAARESSEDVRFELTDNGTGMSTKQLAKIFEPFYTEKEEGAGTGLGLSIIKSLVSRARGSIEVESELGVGTKFTIAIPKAEQKVVTQSTRC